MTQVLILSADALFARMLAIELEMQGISVCCEAEPPREAEAEIVLLDLDTAMPPQNGIYRYMIGFTCRSASTGADAGRLCSLVLRRPFEMRRFREEIGSLLSGQETRREEIQLSADHTQVWLPDGERIAVSPKEGAVMALLLARRGEVITREELAAVIGESTANKAEVYLCYLRRKLETPERRLIQTVRGKGYRLL
jgi:DNA-binding response OmpR family regulator